jgi:glycosyltransferase involved in cell wall biosynthesis
MKIDVIIPVYNTPPAHLLEAVRSIQQPQTNLIILVDDGSDNPATVAVLQVLASTTKQVKVVTIAHAGTPTALNEGHKYITTEYVAIQGSDDISAPNRFAEQLAVLKLHPEIDVVGARLFAFWDHDITRKEIFSTGHAVKPVPADRPDNPWWLVNHGTAVYRNSAVIEVGGYDPKRLRGQDIDLWKRMFNAGKKFHNVNKILAAWRRIKK